MAFCCAITFASTARLKFCENSMSVIAKLVMMTSFAASESVISLVAVALACCRLAIRSTASHRAKHGARGLRVQAVVHHEGDLGFLDVLGVSLGGSSPHLHTHVHLVHGFSKRIVEIQSFGACIPLYLSESGQDATVPGLHGAEATTGDGQEHDNGQEFLQHVRLPGSVESL